MGSLPRRDGDDRRRQHQDHAPAPALDLLDEYWFFSNTLVKNDSAKPGRKPPLLPRSPSTWAGDDREGGKEGSGSASASAGASRFYASGCRRLLRTPSLPSPRVGMTEIPKDEDLVEEEEAATGNQEQQVEVDDDDLNWSSIYEGVLRTRMAEGASRSALRRAPSMPVPSSAMDRDDGGHQTKSTPSMPRFRHSCSTLGRHCRSHTPTAKAEQTPRAPGSGARERRREVRSFGANQQPVVGRSKSSAFQDKKWKSSSDLESIEVQGFKDLGFVFDKEELRESLADVLPGLRGTAASKSKSKSPRSDKGGSVRRPYLSEAWQRSAPPALIRVQPDARSAAEMKDQLRVWAQAVACNVRQEC